MCRRSVGFSIDALQKVLLVPAMMSRCGPSTKAKHGLTKIGSEGSHQKRSSTLSHLPVSGVVEIIGTRDASARTVSQEVAENEDILKFGSLIVLSNTQGGRKFGRPDHVCLFRSRTWSSFHASLSTPRWCSYASPGLTYSYSLLCKWSCTISGWYSWGVFVVLASLRDGVLYFLVESDGFLCFMVKQFPDDGRRGAS